MRLSIPPSGENRRPAGFTLIELLIVIAIIGMLAALVTAAVQRVKGQALVANARTDINTMQSALKAYESDYSYYPGRKDEADMYVNSYPKLYEALCGDPRDGKAGRNAPYFQPKLDNIVVYIDYEENVYEVATKEQLRDVDTEKYYLDPWGNAYRYRENGSKRERQDYMIQWDSYDLWSPGKDGIDQAKTGDTDNDDIGNWS